MDVFKYGEAQEVFRAPIVNYYDSADLFMAPKSPNGSMSDPSSDRGSGSDSSNPPRKKKRNASQLSTDLPGAVSSDNRDTVVVPTQAVKALLDEQETKRQRLARKAELARISRRRKKMRLDELEAEVERLNSELANERKYRSVAEARVLRMRTLASSSDSDGDRSAKQESHRVELSKILEDNASDHEKEVVNNKLLKCATEHGASNVKTLQALEHLLKSDLPPEFLEWVMNQPPSFYTDQKGLWNSVFERAVGITDDQMSSIMGLRDKLVEQRELSQKMHKVFAQLAEMLEQYTSRGMESMRELQAVLTPEQMSRFLHWVSQYAGVVVKIH